MNIVYIHTHDTGRYIEPYGYNVPTHNLMQFAREGTLYRNAFSTAPTCSPSRAGLLTGIPPHQNGMLGLAHRGFSLYDYDKHIVGYLNKNGYETVLSGEQHVAWPDESVIGYNKILSDKNMARDDDNHPRDIENAKMAAQYICGNDKKPFFLSFGMINTHRGWPEEGDTESDYVMPPFPIYDNHAARKDFAGYLNSANIMDTAAGIVLDAVKEAGIENETLVLFTTDHGLCFPNMKCTLYDTGIGVSLIIKYPGNHMKGTATDALVSHLDIYPTICEFLGLEIPDHVKGNSLLSLMEKKTENVRDEIFAEVTFHAAYEPMRCIRTNRFKFIKRFGGYNHIIPCNISNNPVKHFMLEHGYGERTVDDEMLFDLYLDPVERVNLVNDLNYSEVYQKMSGRLLDWMKDTNDPLLEGRVNRPEGAKVNKISCLNPMDKDFEE